MHRKPIAERLVRLPGDQTSQKRQMRLYFFYRFILAFGPMAST